MTDELHCSDHRWSDPQPVWVFNAGRREPCGHVWGPWETVWGGTLGDPSTRYDTGDRVRLCILCGCWEAKWAGDGK